MLLHSMWVCNFLGRQAESDDYALLRFLPNVQVLLNHGARGGNRTRIILSDRGILSPLRLPISPPGRSINSIMAWRCGRKLGNRGEGPWHIDRKDSGIVSARLTPSLMLIENSDSVCGTPEHSRP